MPSWTAVFLLFPACLFGQQVSDWQSLSRLQPGDQVKVSLKSGAKVKGEFRSWSADGVTVGSGNASRLDVIRLDRYRKGGRAKRVVIASLIGAAGGGALGAGVGGCAPVGFGPCFSRAQTGAVGAGAGFVLGAIIGAVIPGHKTEVIFALH